MHRSSIAILGVLGASLVATSTASAGTLSLVNGVPTYTAAPGEKNFVFVNWGNNPNAGPPTLSDQVPVTLGPGCEEVFDFNYACPSAGNRPANFVVHLGDGDDIAKVINDESAGHHSELYGEDGNDQLQSQEGSDLLDGGNGDDQLEPDYEAKGTPHDVVVGGPGTDFLQLNSSFAATVTATLDGVADDGGPGEGDNYGADIENIQGSRYGANRIVGTAGPNNIKLLQDGALNDDISGAGGDDTIAAGAGNDRVDGGDGNDTLSGDAGDDTIIGGAGIDNLSGDGDSLTPGNDRIEARDGNRESINCGIGADTAIIDTFDLVPSDPGSLCESVQRGAFAGAPTTGGAARQTVVSSALRYRRGRIAVRIGCPAGKTCRGSLLLRTAKKVKSGSRRRTVTIGRTKYVVGAGKQKTYRIRPSKTGRSLLRRTRAVSTSVQLVSSRGFPIAKRTVKLRR